MKITVLSCASHKGTKKCLKSFELFHTMNIARMSKSESKYVPIMSRLILRVPTEENLFACSQNSLVLSNADSELILAPASRKSASISARPYHAAANRQKSTRASEKATGRLVWGTYGSTGRWSSFRLPI